VEFLVLFLVLGVAALAALSIGLFLYLRRELGVLREIVVATRPLTAPPPDPASYPYIEEMSDLHGEAAIQFWRGVYESPFWPKLAHEFQVDARTWLRRSRAAAEAKNQAGAIFYAGAAWVSIQLPVLPQDRVNHAIQALRVQEAEKAAKADRDKIVRPGFR
jgi:hypothetical protein